MSDTVLSIQDLTVDFCSFERTVHAVRGCSFDVKRGEIMGLVGESGSGKSVTSMAALGLMATSAELSGSVRVNGQEIIGASAAELRAIRGNKISMIFQNPLTALNPFLRVGRQAVDAVCAQGDIRRPEGQARILEAFGEVRLPDPEIAFNKYPHQMSGGQLQRVMIAMALACQPDLLIADEPTTALDVTVQAQIIILLRELAKKVNLSVLFITHDLGVIASLCDRVAVMYAGQIVESGTTEQVLCAPAHPYTTKLMQTVPEIGSLKSELSYIPGQVPDLARPVSGCAFVDRCDMVMDRCRTLAPAVSEIKAGQMVRCHHAATPAQAEKVQIGGLL